MYGMEVQIERRLALLGVVDQALIEGERRVLAPRGRVCLYIGTGEFSVGAGKGA